MVAQSRAALVLGLLVPAWALCVVSAGCDKLPLLAPSGTVITLFASSTVLPINGSIELTATAIEQGAAPSTGTGGTTGTTSTPGQGTPVHNGTLITFTTTLGTIQPSEARTHNGQVTVRLISTGQSGVATVVAFSGGARSAEMQIRVGAAAVGRIDLAANPITLPSTGGTSELTARVFDTNGNSLAGIPVSFSIKSGAGSLSQSVSITDSTGIARTSITTNRETVVVASAGSGTSGGTGTGGTTTVQPAEVTIRVNAASTLSITTSPANPVENQPTTFTITPGVSGGTGAAIVRNVVVAFGDGTQATLPTVSGATTVSHIYRNSGTFQVSATGTDVNGETVTGSTIVAVNEQLPLAVNLSAIPSTARRGVDTVRFTATATGGSAIRYEWDFGDGTTATTTGGTTEHFYPATTPLGAVRVRVRVIASNAADGLGETTVIITTP